MRNVLRAAVFLLVGATVAVPQDARVPVATSVCQVTSAPERYDGKLIKVRAEVLSDGLEHTVLVDNAKCNKGLVPVSEVANGKDDPFAPIDDAIFRQGRIGSGMFGSGLSRHSPGHFISTRAARHRALWR